MDSPVGQRAARSLPERWPAVSVAGKHLSVQGHRRAPTVSEKVSRRPWAGGLATEAISQPSRDGWGRTGAAAWPSARAEPLCGHGHLACNFRLTLQCRRMTLFHDRCPWAFSSWRGTDQTEPSWNCSDGVFRTLARPSSPRRTTQARCGGGAWWCTACTTCTSQNAREGLGALDERQAGVHSDFANPAVR